MLTLEEYAQTVDRRAFILAPKLPPEFNVDDVRSSLLRGYWNAIKSGSTGPVTRAKWAVYDDVRKLMGRKESVNGRRNLQSDAGGAFYLSSEDGSHRAILGGERSVPWRCFDLPPLESERNVDIARRVLIDGELKQDVAWSNGISAARTGFLIRRYVAKFLEAWPTRRAWASQ